MTDQTISAAAKFDPARANEYAVQSRIALAGYDAFHELAACVLSAALAGRSLPDILVVGAGGTGREIVVAGAIEPSWRFTAVDPSQPMMDQAIAQVSDAGFAGRTTFHLGYVDDLPETDRFDAATLIGVVHHLPTDEAKLKAVSDVAARLKPGAPLILACNRHVYTTRPLFLSAWERRWKMFGATEQQAERKLATILQGANPPVSEEAIALLLAQAGFEPPMPFFSSLFWGAWIARRSASDAPAPAS